MRCVVQAKPADEREPTQRAGTHGEIDDDHVGLLRSIHAETVGQALRLHDLLDAGIFEQLTAALQHDRMVVDDEHAGHDSPPTNSGARVTVVLARSIGIST